MFLFNFSFQVLKQLQRWKEAPADALALSFYYLCYFFEHKIQRGIHKIGSDYVLKETKVQRESRQPQAMPAFEGVMSTDKV